MPSLTLGQTPVGDDVYVIAEAGVNHNGDVELAHRLIDAAAETGADSVKFQTFEPAALVSRSAEAAPYQQASAEVAGQAELLGALTLQPSAWAELRDHAQERELEFLSTPFDLGSAQLLAELGLPALKVGSGELTNLPMLRELAGLGLPLLLSTGMGDEAEVDAAVDAVSAAPSVALFHCVSAYPAPVDQANLRVIPRMIERYDVPVGWSDHTPDDLTALGAVALGASLLEKHFTLDRSMPGPDHLASLEPDALADYVSRVRTMRRALGDGRKQMVPAEEENAVHVRRSWHADRDLPSGHSIEHGDLVALRPATGVAPGIDLQGRTLARSVAAGDPVRPEDLIGD